MEEKGGSSFFAEEALFSACDLRGGCVCGERARVHPHHPLYFLVMNLCLCVDKCSAAVDFWKGQGMMRNVAFFFFVFNVFLICGYYYYYYYYYLGARAPCRLE